MKNEIILFEIEERPCLKDMTADLFFEQFEDCMYLLVLEETQTVLAATRSHNIVAVEAAFAKFDPSLDLVQATFIDGPASLRLLADFIEQEYPLPSP